jgi:hypothetical protein
VGGNGPAWRLTGALGASGTLACASRRASMLVGPEPALAVPVPSFNPGILWR